ncbi:hypothetical protein Pelo_16347 [Pelomyxa schiedti]|nr:hypothetical protein Pelo_16347 [Pelomyxa schiedti]
MVARTLVDPLTSPFSELSNNPEYARLQTVNGQPAIQFKSLQIAKGLITGAIIPTLGTQRQSQSHHSLSPAEATTTTTTPPSLSLSHTATTPPPPQWAVVLVHSCCVTNPVTRPTVHHLLSSPGIFQD